MSDVYVDDVDWKATAITLNKALMAVRRLHQPEPPYLLDVPSICECCSNDEHEVPWPCPTRQALDGPHDTGDDA